MKLFVSAVLFALVVTIQATPIKYYINEAARSNPSDERFRGEQGIYFQGDMMLTNEEVEQRRSDSDKFSPIQNNAKWPDKTVYYSLDGQFSPTQLLAIQNGMNLISSQTCVKFQLRTIQKNSVSVKNGQGCSSVIGMKDKNELELGEGCFVPGIVAHEFLHALGFEHEQSRPDRDDWIIFHKENLADPKNVNQFETYDYSNSNLYGLRYDYGSIMHYGQSDFGKKDTNGKKLVVLEKRFSGPEMGQREKLSPNDVTMVKKRYDC